MTQTKIREYQPGDLNSMIEIWNEVVEEGDAFPQDIPLSRQEAESFFAGQSFTGVFETDDGIAGLYILHPNNVGRCGHISNASYAVRSNRRGQKIGEKLVLHSIKKGKELGFQILQFNAVTAVNKGALYLYKKLGFTPMATIPGGFRAKDGTYIDIIPHFLEL